MKLLQINTSVNTGSTGRIAEQIGDISIGRGFESYIAYGRNYRESNSRLIKIGNDWHCKWHVLSTRLFDNHGFASSVTTKRLINQIDQIQPDIIHLHNIHGYYLNIEVLFQYLSKVNVPVLWTLHDCWALTGHCSHFDFVNCNKWETECRDCPNRKGYPRSLFLDRSRQNFRRKKKLFTSVDRMMFVTPSRWLSDIVSRSYLNKYPVKVLPNGIDLSVFKPHPSKSIKHKYNLGKEKIILGVAKNWNHHKGLDDFIKLSGHLSVNEHIVLVGLTHQQKEYLPDNIIGLNRTENINELAALYSLADVFVNPTWVDNFPTTNIEALACGTPVITYKTGGSIEAVSPKTGLIVEKGNVNELYKAIKCVLETGKNKYESACRERAEKYFNIKQRTLEYLRLYNDLLQGNVIQ